MPFFAVTIRWMAANQCVSGSLVAWKIVPAVGDVCFLHRGVYRFGADEEELPLGSRLAANMSELRVGYIRWWGGEPVDETMVLVGEGEPPPLREDLGDNDQGEWEKDGNDVPRDPWAFTNLLPLKYEVNDEEYTFTTGSRGGIGAIGKLCRAYGRGKEGHCGKLPIVELGASSYRHKSYGEVHVPVLRLTSWAAEAGLITGESAEAEVEEELNDDVPF